MSSTAGTRRGTRVAAAVALAVGALLALGGVAAATGGVSALADTTQHAPFTFD